MKNISRTIWIILIILLIVGGVFWYTQNKQEKNTISTEEKTESVIVQKEKKEQPTKEKTTKNEKKEQAKEKPLTEKDLGENIDTSDWKTYRNEEYGFEVRYPSYFEEISWENNYAAATNDGEGWLYGWINFGTYFITIQARNFPWPIFAEQYEQAKEWQEKVVDPSSEEPGPERIVRKLPKKEDITIDGVKAEKIFEQSPVGVDATPWITLQFEKNGNFYRISVYSDDELSNEAKMVFNKIISSFKFLKPVNNN